MPQEKRLEAIITAYLSEEHVLHPESWCTLAAIAPDIAWQRASVRNKIAGAFIVMPGETAQEQRKNFVILFSCTAGALAMAGVFGDKGIRDQVLAMTRNSYLQTFA